MLFLCIETKMEVFIYVPGGTDVCDLWVVSDTH